MSKFDRFISATKEPVKSKVKGKGSTQPSEPLPKASSQKRPLAKRDNPEYRQALAYVRAETMKSVKSRLAEEEREFSDLVEELLSKWLNS